MQQERSIGRQSPFVPVVVIGVFLPFGVISCSTAPQSVSPQRESVLRIGVDQLASSSASTGFRQFIENFSVEQLLKIDETGRPQPGIGQSWTVSEDRLTTTLQLRPNVRFHDDTPTSAADVVEILQRTLPSSMGAAFNNILSITPQGTDRIQFRLRKGSAILLEALEAQIRKPATPFNIGTGPYRPVESEDGVDLLANNNYYLGEPNIHRLTINQYPTVRNAWAELLRNHVDMVYEVGTALDSLQASTTINVYSYRRHYQYLVLLNARTPALSAPAIRRALNEAINRDEIVRSVQNGHGASSAGPMWPLHWALKDHLPNPLPYDPKTASAILTAKGHAPVTFECLVPSNAERLPLVLQQQLEAVGVQMKLTELSQQKLSERLTAGQYEAILVDTTTGPSIFRSYVRWHSDGPYNRNTYRSVAVDAALDRIDNSQSDDEYRQGVLDFQKAIVDDPPAIFLTWIDRARAVSNRFEVRGAEPGFDMLGTIRMWRPAAGGGFSSTN